MLVASARHMTHNMLYNELASPQERLVGIAVNTAVESIEVVQALLICCLWPVPKQREMHDPSWNYLGVAVNGAMQLGLHQPFAEHAHLAGWSRLGEYRLADISRGTRAMTWLACFNISIRYVASRARKKTSV